MEHHHRRPGEGPRARHRQTPVARSPQGRGEHSTGEDHRSAPGASGRLGSTTRVSHELNNLLIAILGFAELARLELHEHPEASATALLRIEEAVQEAAAIVRRLRDGQPGQDEGGGMGEDPTSPEGRTNGSA